MKSYITTHLWNLSVTVIGLSIAFHAESKYLAILWAMVVGQNLSYMLDDILDWWWNRRLT